MALTIEEREARKEARKVQREADKKAARIRNERCQSPVSEMKISIEWKKSKTWGSNPHLSVEVYFKDGNYASTGGITASGCGYDKESTVIAQVFNMFLKYRLWAISDDIEAGLGLPADWTEAEPPYGIYLRPETQWMNYNGGVGTSCYYRIAEFIGGKFERVASGKTFDAYTLTMK